MAELTSQQIIEIFLSTGDAAAAQQYKLFEAQRAEIASLTRELSESRGETREAKRLLAPAIQKLGDVGRREEALAVIESKQQDFRNGLKALVAAWPFPEAAA
jgi:hypothetical protein